MNLNLIQILFFSILFSANCALGDGYGGSEAGLNGQFTFEGCIVAVKEQYPSANGATMYPPDCTYACSCWAEFGMTGWSGTSYQSCMFNSEGELE